MGTLEFIDAAYPPVPAPHSDGVCYYLPYGDQLHAWSKADLDAQPARYRLAIFVRANMPGPGAAADVAAAVSALHAMGQPEGTLVAWDVEESVDAAYIREVYEGLKAAGYVLIVYGAQSSVFGNDAPDDLYFGADWTGIAHITAGDRMTQWVSFSRYDESEAVDTLPFWDTRKPPTPPEEDEMQQICDTMASTEPNWAATFSAGAYTWIGFYGGPPMAGKTPQGLKLTVHSRQKGNGAEIELSAAGEKVVIDFTEAFNGEKVTDVDGVSWVRTNPDPDAWTPVAFNIG